MILTLVGIAPNSDTWLYACRGNGRADLTGGAPVSVGKPGDWIYEYPGVFFLIREGKVVEFAIQAIQP